MKILFGNGSYASFTLNTNDYIQPHSNLSRFLYWCGINCKVFNSGDYRRKLLEGFQDADFFGKNNVDKREEISKLCFDHILLYPRDSITYAFKAFSLAK